MNLMFGVLHLLLLNTLLLASVEAKQRSFNESINEVADKTTYSNSNELKLVCYYGSWAVYRPGSGKFPVEEIDPFLCSHIIYGFAGLSHSNKIRPLDAYNDLKENWGKGAFQRFNALKQINRKLKTLIAIGGWNEGSVKYSNMAANSTSRKIFVESVVEFLDRYGFDGLDFDWEYPGSRGGKSYDKKNFVQLLKELKEAFRPKNYLLTSAVSAGKAFADPAYDIPQVSKYLDIINVMCYDYHGGWEKRTGHNAPLYARPDEEEDERLLNVNFSINYWIAKGAPRDKIVLGMGTYGRSFALQRAERNRLGAPAPQKGQAGPYTREAGSLGYNEICEKKVKNRDAITEVWDPYHMAPYAHWGRQWVGYDNIESITLKAKYAKAMGLAGGMVWSLETDDFRGLCGDGKYPLLNAIKKVFNDPSMPEMPKPNPDYQPSSTTQRPSTTTTTTTRRPLPTTCKPSTTTTTQRPTTTTTTTQKPTATTTTTTTTQKPTTTTTTTKNPTTTPTATTTTTTTTQKPTTTTTTTKNPTSTPTAIPTTTTTTTTTTQKPSTTTQKPATEATESPSSTTTTQRPLTTKGSGSSNPWWPGKPSTWWPTSPASHHKASSKVWWWSDPTTPKPQNFAANDNSEDSDNPTKDFTCYEEGLYRSPSVCTKFIRCVEMKIEGQFQLFFYECPDRTVFNNETKLCDWVENVPECFKLVPEYFRRGTFQINTEK